MNTKLFLTLLKSGSPETYRAYKGDIDLLRRFLTTKQLRWNQANVRVMSEFVDFMVDDMKLAPATIDRRVAVASSYFDYMSDLSNGRFKNPLRARRFRRSRRRSQKPQPVGEYTLAKLLQGINNSRDYALVDLFIKSGLRISELQQLNRNSIRVQRGVCQDGKEMTLGVGEVVGKGNKRRTFLVDAETCRCLGTLLSERGNDGIDALFVSSRRGRLSTRAIRQRLHFWCKRLGIDRFRVHQLRHTFATRLADAGIDSLVLRDLMGHSSLSTTLGYFNIGEKRVKQEYFAAMEMLSRSGNDQ